jgi:hypothetical protein
MRVGNLCWIIITMSGIGCGGVPDEDSSHPAKLDEIVEPLKPGCAPAPRYICEPFTVFAEYPSPHEDEGAQLNCWVLADAYLEIQCNNWGPNGCCGGNNPELHNHIHPSTQWIDGTWYCSGRMQQRITCRPGVPGCEQSCD